MRVDITKCQLAIIFNSKHKIHQSESLQLLILVHLFSSEFLHIIVTLLDICIITLFFQEIIHHKVSFIHACLSLGLWTVVTKMATTARTTIFLFFSTGTYPCTAACITLGATCMYCALTMLDIA